MAPFRDNVVMSCTACDQNAASEVPYDKCDVAGAAHYHCSIFHGVYTMTLTIYHNPRCSKSREALALVQQFAEEEDIPLEIIEYLKTPPTYVQLQRLQQLLGGDLRAMVRSNEDEYAVLGLASVDDAALLNALAAHPKLLQRPMVVYRDRALIARPPELLRDFLT